MPYTLEMLIENRLIYQVVTGIFSLEEITASALEISTMLDNVEAGEGIILSNQLNMMALETNIMLVRAAVECIYRHPNHKMTVIYGAKDRAVTNFVMNSIRGLYKQRLLAFASESLAVSYLALNCPELSNKLVELSKTKV